jgi:hypothetical protein
MGVFLVLMLVGGWYVVFRGIVLKDATFSRVCISYRA